MKSSLGALGLLALCRVAAAHQQQCESLTSAMPSCALSCVKKAASQVGCTNSADLGCKQALISRGDEQLAHLGRPVHARQLAGHPRNRPGLCHGMRC